MLSNLKTRWLALTIFLDLGFTLLALWGAYGLRLIFPGGVYLDNKFSFAILDEPLLSPWVLTIPLLITWLAVFSALAVYRTAFIVSQYDQVQPIMVAVTGAVLVFAGLAYFFFPELSRFLFLYFYLLDLAFLVGWRKLALWALHQNRFQRWRPKHRILVIGQGELAQSAVSAVRRMTWLGIELVEVDRGHLEARNQVNTIRATVQGLEVDEVIFALPPGKQTLLQKFVFQLQPLPINIRLVPDMMNLIFVRATIEDFAGLPLIGLREPAINAFDRLIKRGFDILVSGFLLLLSSPLFVIIALLIKAESGKLSPIFYTSRRVGEGGRIF